MLELLDPLDLLRLLERLLELDEEPDDELLLPLLLPPSSTTPGVFGLRLPAPGLVLPAANAVIDMDAATTAANAAVRYFLISIPPVLMMHG